MATVLPFGKEAFEPLDKDRDIVHSPPIGFQKASALLACIGLLRHPSQLLPHRLDPCRAVTGFDALKNLVLAQGLGLRHFAEQMKVIGHQGVGQDPNTAEGLQAAQEPEESFGLRTPSSRRALKDEATLNDPGNAVVKTPTLSLDTWETHVQAPTLHNTQQKCSKSWASPKIFDLSLIHPLVPQFILLIHLSLNSSSLNSCSLRLQSPCSAFADTPKRRYAETRGRRFIVVAASPRCDLLCQNLRPPDEREIQQKDAKIT